MRVLMSWLREFAPVPEAETGRQVGAALVQAGLEVETVDVMGEGTSGPLVVGRVLDIEELTEFKKSIRFCRVAVGVEHGHPDTPGERGIICGATNFAVDDLVVVALPGSTLPGGFEIGSRETYGRVSDGMICAERELGLGEDHDGILVLPPDTDEPGANALETLNIGDEVLDIAVTPDRGYALSIRGVAREAATAYGVPFTDPGIELPELPVPEGEPHECGSDDPSGCDLFTLRTITDFDPQAPTPQWMRNRLIASGTRSINLAVDVTNYIMVETGQPSHVFALDALSGPIGVRRANAGETLETLDHVTRKLDPDDLVVVDNSGVISLGGTMGGLTTEVTDESINLALEAAHWDEPTISRMSRRHKLSSEASRRFERGVDRMLAPIASARATALLLEYGGGTYVGMTAAESPLEPVTIATRSDLPQQVAGMPIDSETTIRHLEEVGCQVAVDGDRILVVPPTWRPDLTDPNDLAEEVIRLVGFDEIPSELPVIPSQSGYSLTRKLTRRIGLALAGAGYVETPAYPFVGAREMDGLQLSHDDPRRATVRLANPMSDEQPLLRTSLLPGLFGTATRNLSRGSEGLRLFEIGSVFRSKGKQASDVPRPDVARRPEAADLEALDALLPDQPTHLAVFVSGDHSPPGWWGEARDHSWADAVSAAKRVAAVLGVEIGVETGRDPVFHPGRCARLTLDGEPVGSAGELHPRVIEAFSLPPRASALELDLGWLISSAQDIVEAPAVGTMPVAKEDVALVVGTEVPAEALAQTLIEGGGELLESVRLFDEYSGEQVGAGKKSLAFALRFRAPDRTLKSAEVATARQSAVSAATAAFGAELRG